MSASSSRDNIFSMIRRCLGGGSLRSILRNVDLYFEAIDYSAAEPFFQPCIDFKLANLPDDNVPNDVADLYRITELRENYVERLLADLSGYPEYNEFHEAMPKELLRVSLQDRR